MVLRTSSHAGWIFKSLGTGFQKLLALSYLSQPLIFFLSILELKIDLSGPSIDGHLFLLLGIYSRHLQCNLPFLSVLPRLFFFVIREHLGHQHKVPVLVPRHHISIFLDGALLHDNSAFMRMVSNATSTLVELQYF